MSSLTGCESSVSCSILRERPKSFSSGRETIGGLWILALTGRKFFFFQKLHIDVAGFVLANQNYRALAVIHASVMPIIYPKQKQIRKNINVIFLLRLHCFKRSQKEIFPLPVLDQKPQKMPSDLTGAVNPASLIRAETAIGIEAEKAVFNVIGCLKAAGSTILGKINSVLKFLPPRP